MVIAREELEKDLKGKKYEKIAKLVGGDVWHNPEIYDIIFVPAYPLEYIGFIIQTETLEDILKIAKKREEKLEEVV